MFALGFVNKIHTLHFPDSEKLFIAASVRYWVLPTKTVQRVKETSDLFKSKVLIFISKCFYQSTYHVLFFCLLCSIPLKRKYSYYSSIFSGKWQEENFTWMKSQSGDGCCVCAEQRMWTGKGNLHPSALCCSTWLSSWTWHSHSPTSHLENDNTVPLPCFKYTKMHNALL